MANRSRAKLGQVSISRYISQNFSKAFLTIFLPLFFIGSLVFIVKLSSLTSLFQVSFIEMTQLFFYNLPTILFYIIPISFLVAVTTTLLRLSTENELMALIALGIQAKQIIRYLWIIAILFSLLLLTLSLAKMPQADQQYSLFKAEKSTQAKLNISPSQLGQKFGDFFIYLKDKKGEKMEDIVIYKKDEKHFNQLFIAKSATIENTDSSIQLTLNDGSGYTFEDRSLSEINYETMQIFQNLHSDGYNYKNLLDHWIRYSYHPTKKRKILFFIFISLIPMMGLYIVSAFSIINPRYQKNYAYHVLGVTTVALYIIATTLKSSGSLLLLGLAIVSIFSLGLILFRYKVSRFF
ncbi:MAG TPA: LptF/LptG family permease [Campylobacterales bacterium]|nr:LptF/LptG family permease [Campylobacterales bacterium]HIP42289.1 LptF/LptG family permease [Campylobacterales bacterium]